MMLWINIVLKTDIWSLTSCSLSGLPIIIGLAVSRKRLLTLPSTRCFRYLQFFPTRYLVSRRKKSSYANQMIVRVGRQPYYLSKGIVCFSAAFITIVIPLILNFAVTAAFIPSTVPQINYEIYNHVYFGAMWADLFYTHPALYVALYILLDGLFAGLIALIGYAFSFYITNQFAAAAFPVTAFWGIDYLSGLLARAIPGAKWSYEISPIAYLHPATLRYDPNAAIILIEAVMLFCSAIAIIFKRGVWHE